MSGVRSREGGETWVGVRSSPSPPPGCSKTTSNVESGCPGCEEEEVCCQVCYFVLGERASVSEAKTHRRPSPLVSLFLSAAPPWSPGRPQVISI